MTVPFLILACGIVCYAIWMGLSVTRCRSNIIKTTVSTIWGGVAAAMAAAVYFQSINWIFVAAAIFLVLAAILKWLKIDLSK